MAAMEETMAYSADNAREEHLQRFQQPDGHCLQCGRPANQYHPVGPITVTISEPSDETFVHEFCNWKCFGEWAAVQAGGVFVVDRN
jgi:hypothetical protein